jgi:Flp pilus assembly pilin Flp
MLELLTYLRCRIQTERGQTMAEYAVVLAVITLAIIAALTALSGGISTALSNVTKNL